MTNLEFLERYDFALHWLQRRRAYVAAAVMRLGRVHVTRGIATAAIVAREQDVWLYFNPDFCEGLENVELAAVLTHEAFHFALAHQKRAAHLQNQRDRFFFSLAADAVINDLIQASFPEMKLPAAPVTGLSLVGQDTSQMSAEQVFQLLRQRVQEQGIALEQKLIALEPLDEHWVWDPEVGSPIDDGSPPDRFSPSPDETEPLDSPDSTPHLPCAGLWTEQTSALVRGLGHGLAAKDPCWGTVAAGLDRPAQPAPRCRKNLARFLHDSLDAGATYETLWTVPNRKLMAAYPRVILPTYQTKPRFDLLMAIDASGSVPQHFISAALAFAQKHIPRTRIKLISFDTAWYECDPKAGTVKGGGGTRAQAVEDYILQRAPRYPHHVFLFTDGFTPAPAPLHPERWTWLLPPWGVTQNMPAKSRAVFFEAEEMSKAV